LRRRLREGIVSHVEERDEQVLFEVLFDVRRKLERLLDFLAEDDDEEAEDE
jgi:hypothetical protein